MPWFWFILMLLTLLVGNSASSPSGFAAILQGMAKSDPNPLVLLGPALVALLLAKAWMVYIGRYVESGDLSLESAANMWGLGLRWATFLGASAIALLEPLAGVTNQVLRAKEYSETWGMLLALMPLLLFAMMMDSLAYQWEQYCVHRTQSEKNASELEKPWLFLWRKAQFSWLLPVIPMLFSCLGVDLLKLCVSEEVLQRWTVLFVPLLALVVALAVGWLLLSMWTESLGKDHPHGKQWLHLYCEIGEPLRDIRVWRTGNRINNAMLLGFTSRFRYVILTDKLLNSLSPRELEMVLLHEAAHSKCRHGVKRFSLLAIGVAVMASAFQGWCWLVTSSDSWNSGLDFGSVAWNTAYWGGVAGLFLLGVAWAWSIKWLWHQTELEADRVACLLSAQLRQEEYAASGPGITQGWNERRQLWKSAMELSAALCNLVGSEQRASRDSWTHPSVKARVQKLAEDFAIQSH